VWLNRGVIDGTRPRDVMFRVVMLLLAIGLVPLGLWMMIRRPEQNWERELRLEAERSEREQEQ
jgi:high-affinity Fe2+/Pb2+ permease